MVALPLRGHPGAAAQGLGNTLKAFACASVLSLALGALLACGRLSEHRVLRWISTLFVEFFRAMPVLVMIFFVFVALKVQPLPALVAGLTLYNGSVLAEVFRTGVHSVARGQGEAAYALGMRKTQVMTHVLVPQAVRAMLPAIISQLVVALKDTSLGFLITYEEFLHAGKLIASNLDYDLPFIPVVLVISPIYIGMCMLLSWCATWVARRERRDRGRRPRTSLRPDREGRRRDGGDGYEPHPPGGSRRSLLPQRHRHVRRVGGRGGEGQLRAGRVVLDVERVDGVDDQREPVPGGHVVRRGEQLQVDGERLPGRLAVEGVRGVGDQLADAERAHVVEVRDEGAALLRGGDRGVHLHRAAHPLRGVVPLGLPDAGEGAGEEGTETTGGVRRNWSRALVSRVTPPLAPESTFAHTRCVPPRSNFLWFALTDFQSG